VSPARVQIRCERFPVLSETFVVNEARALGRLGHDVEVYAHERPGEPGPGTEGIRVRYRSGETRGTRARAVIGLAMRHPIGVLADLLARRRWRRAEPVAPLRLLAPGLRGLEGRHVHVHFAKASALDALRGHRLVGVPFSLTAHAYDIYAAPANLAEKLAAATFVTTGCEYTARDLRALGGPVHVIVMGVDTERFRRTRPPAEGRTVLAVGRLVEKKGFVHLVRAAADPALHGLLDELRIVGDGPLQAGLRAEAQRLGVADRVTFVGALDPDAVRAELEGAAVLAAPCVIAADGDRDSMPVVVKEALAMEVPVVASDTVGLPEIVRPAFGRLVTAGDPAALAAALAELLGLTAAERSAMGRAGREHVREHAELAIETARLSQLLGGGQTSDF
jgi:colanic acid/amylovoran biosynthesis glycosyltransferase